MEVVLQLVSLVGAGLVLGAYFALQLDWCRSHGPAYLWCNFVGAVLLAVVATVDRRVGFVLLEAAWAGVSLMAIVLGPRAPHDRAS